MTTLLTNKTYPGSDIDVLGYRLAPPIGGAVDNGPVLFDRIKPVTPYSRWFFDGEAASVSGQRVTTWKNGAIIVATATRQGTSMSSEALRRWLPGTPVDWNTASSTALMWLHSVTVDSFPEVQIEALSRAKTAGWDVLTMVAERRKTAEMLASLHTRLSSLLRRAVSEFRDPARMRAFLRGSSRDSASSYWLEARYGIRPLCYDIIEAYLRLTRDADTLFRVKADGASSTQSSGAFDPGNITGSNLPAGWTQAGGISPSPIVGSGQYTVLRNFSVYCGFGVESSVAGRMTANPVLTAWELVPLSFLLDLVINIGDLLTAFAPAFNRYIRYGWATIREDVVFDATASFLGTNLYAGTAKPSTGGSLYYPGRTTSSVVCHTQVFGHRFTRVALQPGEIPAELDFRWDVDLLHVADVVSLLLQNKRRLRGMFKS